MLRSVLITNHVVAGAVIGALVPRPSVAFGLGVVSHAAMDAWPHWGHPDYSVFLKVAVVDGLVGLTTMATLARARDLLTLGVARRGLGPAGLQRLADHICARIQRQGVAPVSGSRRRGSRRD